MSVSRAGHQAFEVVVCSVLLLVGLCALFPIPLSAQRSAASINGAVKDASGAVIPQATVTLTNVETAVKRVATTNDTGEYVLLDINPGRYTLAASREGFSTATQAEFTLNVNQTATFDFSLPVGATTQTIEVQASAARVEASTAELGTAITTREVNDLPLNGRNFTELLSLTPGVSPISVAQNAGGWTAEPLGSFSFPSVNGQSNRSNFFMLDGINNQGVFESTYAIAPIVDDMQEFKVQSHNDEAQFGGALGGIVNVVTKSGTNAFHGSAWEFLRNNVLDSRNFFTSEVTPFKQNQFGGAVGGPVVLPGYNGRNKTFFYTSYEGFRRHTASDTPYRVPTPQELSGDLSDIVDKQGKQIPIYNPFSTRPDPANPGLCPPTCLRDRFPNNQIPSNLLDPKMLLFATLFPKPVATGLLGFNGRDTTPVIVRQDEGSVRFDEQFRDRDSAFIRYHGLTQPTSSSAGYSGLVHQGFFHGYNLGVSYVHTFVGSAVLQVEFGRNSMQINGFNRFSGAPAGFWEQVGFSPNFASNFRGGFSFIPSVGISDFLGGGESIDKSHIADVYEYKADFSKVHGRHTFKAGVDISSSSFDALYVNAGVGFSSFQTSKLNPLKDEDPGGSALASFLLGVPDNGGRRNVHETEYGGWVHGFYFQDQWKATDKLTVNLGGRYDVTFIPRYGSDGDQNNQVGALDLNNGTYILQRSSPACGNGVGAPCIPGGVLPAHVIMSKNGKVYHNSYDNWQPRVGLAYRLRSGTVLRASYGRFFDNWAAVNQTAQNYEGTWPDIGQLLAQNLNNPTGTSLTPTVSTLDPFHLGSAPPLPAPTPFNQVQWYMDPLAKNPYSDQWNFGVQHQLTPATTLSANYVGSHSGRLDIGGFYNVAVTPGLGDQQSRRPYPYIAPTFYDRSVGRSSYNAFQFSLDRKSSRGLGYLVAYTWSKAMDIGCSGWYGVEGCSVQDPYDLNANKSVAGFDLTHVLSTSWVYALPLGKGRKWSTNNRFLDYTLGNWQLNGIMFLSSGPPYEVGISGDIANTGNVNCCSGYYERLNLVGNPNPGNRDPDNWLNKSAFAAPAPLTFGSLGRNGLRADWTRNFDLSIFREFPISESKRLQFRFETFNSFNTPTFGFPVRDSSAPKFGRVTYTANQARQLQFALKLYF